MYIRPTISGYDRSGEQVARRGDFLIILELDQGFPVKGPKAPLRAVVRKVALHQCGCWMMGRANIGGKWLVVSGAYGSDGLPKTVPAEVYERGIQLPPEVEAAFWKGDGHNSSGSEGPTLRQWALETFK